MNILQTSASTDLPIQAEFLFGCLRFAHRQSKCQRSFLIFQNVEPASM